MLTEGNPEAVLHHGHSDFGLLLSLEIRSCRRAGPMKANGIMVCVRKHRLSPRELVKRQVDVIRMQPPNMLVAHAPRHHVYLERTF
ncbi:Hypothetical predicted protein [Drosophila guanche]|uniref:Uncharacterized protein n=1 Tax=Drosophila guanche TaxID=7266 RepID=A0A3B0JNB0_DROGU|nr:Hypothetical predicted protein [Drosophila guanche]